MIDAFHGKHAFMSNFYVAPFTIGTITYPTVEHGFQANKTLDEPTHRFIVAAPDPGSAKLRGRKATLRPDWEARKFGLMTELLREKFAQNPQLVRELLATGNEILVEGNHWHDQIWGDCRCPAHVDVPGLNALGTILMGIRLELIAQESKAAEMR